jgi:mono/diheme cytochrome c family protein
MVLGLTGRETGLLLVALVFVLFALTVAMVIPRRWPDFPGYRLGLFILIAFLLFVSMMTAVVVATGGEEHEEAAAEETQAGGTESGPTETETGTGGETQPGGAAEGDAAAGEQVFASAGCASCHTLAAANASGTVGPNLDEAKPPASLVVERVTNGMGVMPSFKGQLSEQQIEDVAAYVSESAGTQ